MKNLILAITLGLGLSACGAGPVNKKILSPFACEPHQEVSYDGTECVDVGESNSFSATAEQQIVEIEAKIEEFPAGFQFRTIEAELAAVDLSNANLELTVRLAEIFENLVARLETHKAAQAEYDAQAVGIVATYAVTGETYTASNGDTDVSVVVTQLGFFIEIDGDTVQLDLSPLQVIIGSYSVSVVQHNGEGMFVLNLFDENGDFLTASNPFYGAYEGAVVFN